MKNINFVIGLMTTALLSACSTTSAVAPAAEANSKTKVAVPSTLQSYNQTMHSFNKGAYEYVFNPIGNGLEYITPDFIEDVIFNIFDNLSVPNTAINNALQGKFASSGHDIARFGINSTVGLLGIIDVASFIGIENNQEDFGQTLATYGVDSGPFVVLPFVGGATPRAMTGMLASFDPLNMTDKDTKKLAEQFGYFTMVLDGSGEQGYPSLDEQKSEFIAMRECNAHDGASVVKASCDLVCDEMISEIRAEYLAIEDSIEKQEMRAMAPMFVPSFCSIDFDVFDAVNNAN